MDTEVKVKPSHFEKLQAKHTWLQDMVSMWFESDAHSKEEHNRLVIDFVERRVESITFLPADSLKMECLGTRGLCRLVSYSIYLADDLIEMKVEQCLFGVCLTDHVTGMKKRFESEGRNQAKTLVIERIVHVKVPSLAFEIYNLPKKPEHTFVHPIQFKGKKKPMAFPLVRDPYKDSPKYT